MALASGEPVVSGVHVVASICHGTASEQTLEQVCPEDFSRGNPNIILPLQEFDAACDWLEQHTLIGYFVVRTPTEAMLRECVNKNWTPHGVRLDTVQNLTKGFFLFFRFANPSQADAILRSSLLVFEKWSQDFTVSEDKKLRVPVWVEFPGLPLPC